VGCAVSQRFTTEQPTLPAIKNAIKSYSDFNLDIKALIFHSDASGQNYDKEYLKLTT